MTAMSVARGCNMVQPHQKLLLVTLGPPQTTDTRPRLAMEARADAYVWTMEGKAGAVLRIHYPELLPSVINRGMVFGRFGPDQKTQLVTALQAEDLIVGMCGDEANDCGALKAAHVGVSLSEFYSILGKNQFLYTDLVLTTLLALSLGRASPGPILTKQSPLVSLVAMTNYVVVTLMTQAVFVTVLLLCPWKWLADFIEIEVMNIVQQERSLSIAYTGLTSHVGYSC
ncbi:unnamed protein product [Danaus chrysippus]|uniref:(African queen) hypothetical protein n=1 Tax=Danaus chrysippus TaxID=151541 RepID=A0A8J2QK04_9NEOP|nr:unnamed protein product [Danaus chrysippus]